MSQGSPEWLGPEGGIVLIDKPKGPTSHDVVQRARRLLGERRIGHTGTLDPFASGLLVLCVGPAARLGEYLSGLSKDYEAYVRLGERTPTLDDESSVVEVDDRWQALTPEEVEDALQPLRGTILQTPPVHSAKRSAVRRRTEERVGERNSSCSPWRSRFTRSKWFRASSLTWC